MRFLISLCVPLLLLVKGEIINGQTTASFSSPDIDPCYIYTSLDEPWRAINSSYNNYSSCDYNVNWDGWYRLLNNGENAQMPESCVSSGMCGSYSPLWLNGSHPRLVDGVVSREVCSPTWNDCCGYKSRPIHVKACPGNYFVYQFVKPIFCAIYCADVKGLKTTSVPKTTVTYPLSKSITVPGISVKTAILPFDPCKTYTVLDEPWRATSNKYAVNLRCDTSVSWSGWYRLFIRGQSVQMPDTCVDDLSCGTHAPLWLNGTHPRVGDGVVTRAVCGNWFNNCCYFQSNPIKVKACPGNYYVYEFTSPTFCYGTYCADDRNMTIPTAPPETTLSGALLADPCYNYTVIDEPWRAIDQYSQLMCDSYVNWSGWYRLFLHGQSAKMPDTCVSMYSCSSHAPLWLNGPHPRVEDGVVTRHVCGHWNNDCCHFEFYPMKVKACPGNYYVYEFVSPTYCYGMYCAVSDPRSNNMSYISVTPKTTQTVPTTPMSDPCHDYNVLDDFWRSISLNLNNGHNDLVVEWNGWYRLFLNGQTAQMSEWCVTHTGCGGDTGLYLNGSHPRLGDGVVTREVLGTYMWYPNQCGTYRSNPIQVKACPGDYYVYKLVKPDMSIPRPTYCAVAFKSIRNDPCYNYTSLDRPWRAANESGLTICDNSFSYNGWYRLLHNGMNIRMSDNCVGQYSCNTQVGLWLNGSHPQIKDGVVTREVCGDEGISCCSFKSTPIRVKACPGNYYVYEIVKTSRFCSAFCTDVNTISQMISPTPPGVSTASLSTMGYEPCYFYNIVDDYWRSALNNWNVYGQITGNDDTVVEWDGWYRLYLNGSSAQMPDWCATYMSCGGFSSLWLGGPHPNIQDGVVTREVYGTQNDQCGYYRSNSIKVKACPGKYYVYKFVKPRQSIPMPVYCAVPSTTPNVDPCYNYTSLDDIWRGVNYSNLYNYCDYNVDWNGWYRLFYNGQSAKMPDSCVGERMCGSYYPLWLNGSHPQLEDGVVTRQACSPTYDNCCGYKSLPIQVKACPGNYYVYQFVKPLYCAAYCSDRPNFHTPSPSTVTISPPTSISVPATAPVTHSLDPCFNYTVLDEPWRATSNQNSVNLMCDRYVSWSGWYRLFIRGQSVQMPTTCVAMLRCGTHAPLWLNGTHPRVEDGVVTRAVCGHWMNDCCYFHSNPIKVKACPGNYYVYEFTMPNYCSGTYCADVSIINTNYSTIMPSVMPTEAVTSISDPCSNYNILDNIWRDIHQAQFSSYGYDDRFVEWNGWYRLFLNGQSARMSEGCTSYTGCGGDTGLYLNGSHPRLVDGVVTREVLGTIMWYPNLCDYYRSDPIQIKACPGDYYVYKLVKPDMSIPRPTYCAVTFNNISNDPCYNYESLDRPWRATNESGLTICDDTLSWNSWYRLLYDGMNIRMSEKCASNAYSCNAYYSLWLNGPHPHIEDGVVIREICVSSHRGCCAQKFTPIRVKACPGNYYVYELAQPPQYYCTGYCTDVSTISQIVSTTTPSSISGSVMALSASTAYHDPCYNYNILDNYWRSTLGVYVSGHDDTRVGWDGWYRLYLNAQSAQIPDWCAGYMACGGFSSLWLAGTHPQPKDGIVTREVYGTQYGQCSTYRSNPIQVKACPGNFYVYKLIRPKLSIPVPSYCAVAFNTPSVDPCISYTSLEEPWRSTNYISNNSFAKCDYNVNWNGWYRLFYNGQNGQMPESCVGYQMCGTAGPLWLNGHHPQLEDGVVTRQVCASSSFSCCSYNSHPIQVKACPGNYYVYEFVKPALCSAYCAEAQSLNQTLASTTEMIPLTSSAAVTDPCSHLNCTENEWCGKHNGVYGCFCNRTHPTSNPDTFDAHETCESSSGFMSLSRCQLFEAGFSADVLHLNDPSCRGTVQNGRIEFRFDNNGHICGTGLVANGTHIIYENFIFGQQGSVGGVISRKKFLKLRFNCVYFQAQSVSMDINPLESIVHRNIQGLGTYKVRMISYQDAQFSKPFSGSVSVEVDQRIFVEVRVDGVDDHQFSSVIDSCWATPVNDPQSSLRWDLIAGECPNPNDETVELLQNGVSTSSRFSFKMFIFTANSTKVYLHCKIHLCLLANHTCSSPCYPGHHQRKRRSLDFHDTAAISMGPLVWSKGHSDIVAPKQGKVSKASGLCGSLMLLLVLVLSAYNIF